MNKKVASGMIPGTHGSTFGGNPLAMAVGNAVFDEVIKPGFMEHVDTVSDYMFEELRKTNFPEYVDTIRGTGLMIGIKLKDTIDCKDVVVKLREKKLLKNSVNTLIMRCAKVQNCIQ